MKELFYESITYLVFQKFITNDKKFSSMKWKDRVFILLFGLFMLIFVKWFVRMQHSNNVTRDNVVISLKRKHSAEGNIPLFISNSLREGENDTNNWSSMHAWDIWQEMVSKRSLTHPSEKNVQKILQAMSTSKITLVDVGHRGTQLKAKVFLQGPQQQQIVFKPRRLVSYEQVYQ